MVRTWHFHCCDPGSVPGGELRSRKLCSGSKNKQTKNLKLKLYKLFFVIKAQYDGCTTINKNRGVIRKR